jgi:hypothetical protein
MTTDTRISLDPDGLHAEAVQVTGLDDYGPDGTYRKPMSVFLQSVADADRGATFEQAAHDRAVQILSTRLHFVEHAKEHPEVLDERIERPVILIGLPRTGTTILYDVLALDPAARPPLEWEAQIPWPPPETATYDRDERIALVQAGVDQLLEVAPEVLETHPMGARLPAECNTIMEYHFSGPDWWARFGTDAYTEWVATQRAEGCYRTHMRFLQNLQWHGPRGRWTLKSPGHLFDLEGLLDTYPDACLVWTHRDPATVMASLAAFVRPFRRLLGGDDDKLRMGESTTLLWGNALERGVLSRNDPRVESAVFDLAFKEVQADPAAAARRVHEHFGLPLSEGHRLRMTGFLAEHALGSSGSQRYTFAEYGIEPDAIRARFPAYCSRFADLF